MHINGFSEEAWKYVLSLPVFKILSVITLTEHHLSATFQPEKVIDRG